MFHHLDSTIRAILADPAAPALVREAEVSFLTPDRNFTPNGLTLNLFLHEVHENTVLRSPLPVVEREGSGFERRQAPLRVDCTYLVSAWSNETGEAKIIAEHELLGLVLAWLSRFPTISEAHTQGSLVDQLYEPPTLVAQTDTHHATEFWSALGIAPRIGFSLTVTVALDLDLVVRGPLVTAVGTDYQSGATALETIYAVSGLVYGAGGQPLAGASVSAQETGALALTNEAGQFRFGRMPGGPLTILVRASGYVDATRSVLVPGSSADYTFTLEAET
jgi:hypothetical protein